MGCSTFKPDPAPPMNAQLVASPNNDAWVAEQYRKEQAKKKKAVSLFQACGVRLRIQAKIVAEEGW
jgi:hypothetical protein